MTHWLTLLLFFMLGCFFGCGGDDVFDNDGSIADAASDNDDFILGPARDDDFILDPAGDDDRVIDDVAEVPAAAFLSAAPANGSDIATNGVIVITFDNNPGEVTANVGTVAGAGKTRAITGPFTPGALTIAISWTNGEGSHALVYTVIAPDITAPTVTGGSVKDGGEDVDPAVLNEDGIEITFSEIVVGNIALQTEGGENVGWLGRVDGDRATLIPLAGKEIGNETTYVITGRIADAAGNETELSITFTTQIK